MNDAIRDQWIRDQEGRARLHTAQVIARRRAALHRKFARTAIFVTAFALGLTLAGLWLDKAWAELNYTRDGGYLELSSSLYPEVH